MKLHNKNKYLSVMKLSNLKHLFSHGNSNQSNPYIIR